MKNFFILVMLSLFALSSLTYAQKKQDSDREAFHEAMDSCLEENGLERPERGIRPSDEDRKILETCMEEKGFKRPNHPPRGNRPGDGENRESL